MRKYCHRLNISRSAPKTGMAAFADFRSRINGYLAKAVFIKDIAHDP